MKVFIFRAVHTGRSAAVLTAIVVLFGVAAAHASVTTKTLEALTSYPDGGPGLEVAITEILDEHTGQPHIAAREILAAAASASDEQMVAIGEALAARAQMLAQSDLGESRAIEAVVRDSKNAVLQKIFLPTSRGRMRLLVIPSGGEQGGGFDTSPN